MLQPGDSPGFLVNAGDRRMGLPTSSAGKILIRTSARSLAGMQKEAVVECGASGPCWRLVSDEGAWLNGTDLAPFPLAFFTAGLASSCLSTFVVEARERGVTIESLHLVQDNFYTMEGSALRGTMSAGVKPAQMQFFATGSASAAEFSDIARVAVTRSPAVYCLANELHSEFSIQINDQCVSPIVASGTEAVLLSDPAPAFASISRASTDSSADEIIRKLSGDTSEPVTKADAVGLQAEQKRVVHVRTRGHIRSDGMKVLAVQCVQPAGSTFEFLSDDSAVAGGEARAPSGLALLSCGVAFCFMTQIGRYATITKQQLRDYRIAQATGFCLPVGGEPSAEPVRTFVCLDTGESESKTRELVRMGEQTCYLHAAFRLSTDTDVSFQSHAGL